MTEDRPRSWINRTVIINYPLSQCQSLTGSDFENLERTTLCLWVGRVDQIWTISGMEIKFSSKYCISSALLFKGCIRVCALVHWEYQDQLFSFQKSFYSPICQMMRVGCEFCIRIFAMHFCNLRHSRNILCNAYALHASSCIQIGEGTRLPASRPYRLRIWI